MPASTAFKTAGALFAPLTHGRAHLVATGILVVSFCVVLAIGFSQS